MSPKFFALALTAALFAGTVAQADESGSRYRRRPQPQQQVQQQPDDQYYDGQDYQQGGGYQGGYQQEVVVGGGYQQGCCAPPMPPPPIECCSVQPIQPIYPVRPIPPAIMPYGGSGIGICRIIQNNIGWTVLVNGQVAASGRNWQAGQLNYWRARGCY